MNQEFSAAFENSADTFKWLFNNAGAFYITNERTDSVIIAFESMTDRDAAVETLGGRAL